MNISEIIEEGLDVLKKCYKKNDFGSYISGPEYENWLRLAIRYLESNFPNDKDTEKFRELADKANRNGEKYFDTLIAILRAFQKVPPAPIKTDIFDTLKSVCMNFYKFDTSIKRRHNNRETIKIENEYDLQDALNAILKLFINDVRKEDYVSSNAGANSRVDFLLPEHGIIIETKMTNENLCDSKIGAQLLVDIGRYKQKHKEGYNHLICFVYDKNSHISNPSAIIKDLESHSDKDMRITVFISP